MPSVVHFSTAHSIGDTRIFHKELQTLSNDGYDCHYVVFDDGKNEVRDGVTIHPIGNRSRRDRWLDMGQLYTTVANLDADIYHFHDLELIPVGIALKLKTSGKVIYDAHENYPHLINDRDWIPGPLRPLLNLSIPRIEALSGDYFDGVVAATEWVEESLKNRGVRAVTTIHNYPKTEEISISNSKAVETDSAYLLAYTGGLSKIRGIMRMVEVIAELRERGVDVSLVCLGAFSNASEEAEAKDLADELEVADAIDFKGYVDYKQMFQYLAAADIGLALLDIEHYKGGIPTKIFEYMYSRLPVVVTDILATDRYVSDDWGRIVPERNTVTQADVIEDLLDDPQTRDEMGRAGRNAVESKFSWESEEKILLDLYENVIK